MTRTFIWDFLIESTMGQMLDWLYNQVVGFLTVFFTMMGGMGAELFTMPWVEALILFFRYFAWTLYAVGLLVSVFEFGMEYQTGRARLKDLGLNTVKGFLAAALFSTLPVEVYKLAISLQGQLTGAITGITQPGGVSTGDLALSVLGSNLILGGGHMLFALFVVIVMGYAIIKVFFSNLKRGGILLIQIAVGSLYLFSIPRGYIDGFTGWSKQVIGVCLTAFLQTTILTAGLLVFDSHLLLGLGLMLSANEIPRIAGQFGLDTSTKANFMNVLYAAQQAVSITKTVVAAVK